MSLISQSPGAAILNPKPILDMNYAFAQTALLMVAVRLHIFTYLASDPLTAASLAALVKVQPEPATRFLICYRTNLLLQQRSVKILVTQCHNH